MSRRTKKQPLPQPERATYPAVIDHLARAFRAGEDCGAGLHDALLEAGHPGLAGHFAGDCACRPGTRCLAVEEILNPRPTDPHDPTSGWAVPNRKPRQRGYDAEFGNCRATFLTVCRTLEEQGIARADVLYDGSGDNGAVDGFQFWDRKGQEIELAIRSKSPEPVANSPANLTKQLDELVCALLPGGWGNGSGSFGVVIVNTLTRRVHLAHSWRVESTQEESFDWKL